MESVHHHRQVHGRWQRRRWAQTESHSHPHSSQPGRTRRWDDEFPFSSAPLNGSARRRSKSTFGADQAGKAGETRSAARSQRKSGVPLRSNSVLLVWQSVVKDSEIAPSAHRLRKDQEEHLAAIVGPSCSSAPSAPLRRFPLPHAIVQPSGPSHLLASWAVRSLLARLSPPTFAAACSRLAGLVPVRASSQRNAERDTRSGQPGDTMHPDE